MDNYFDRAAQLKNAQDMIRANSMAEAAEKERMASRLAGYEEIFQDMQKCSLQNLENAEKVTALLTAGLQKIEEVQKKDESVGDQKQIEELKNLVEEMKAEQIKFFEEMKAERENAFAEMKKLSEAQETQMKEFSGSRKEELEKLNQSLQDFTHKESVKVYRNVQAVIEETAEKQKKEIAELKEEKSDSGKLTAVWILTLLAALANIGFTVAQYLGLL